MIVARVLSGCAGCLIPVITLSFVCLASTAHGYIDRAKFAAPVEGGGGGGVFFTGSPRDPHVCGVCHEGGRTAMDLMFQPPLPTSFAPGAPIDIGIVWLGEDEGGLGAGSLEVVDENGDGLGTIDVVDDPQSRCAGAGAPAGVRTEVGEDGRVVVGALACGARGLLARWTPPVDSSSDQVAFVHASAVVAGTDSGAGSPAGDEASAIQAVLGSEGGSRPLVTKVGSGCQLGGPLPPCGALGPWGLLALAGWLGIRRRGRREAR